MLLSMYTYMLIYREREEEGKKGVAVVGGGDSTAQARYTS